MRITHMKRPIPIAQDDWVMEAFTDDEMVVELLLRIKHAGTVESENNPAVNLPLLRWGSRRQRSLPSRLGVSVRGLLKKAKDTARGSPVTPLCWSGGSGSRGSTCPSAATVDGFEDTSCSTSNGSKAVRLTNDITSSKRSKRQKIFLDLKYAENLQLKKRLDLEKKIANVQVTHEKRSAKNQSLKRIKFEYSDRIKNIPVGRSILDESRKKRRLPFFITRKQVKTEHSYRTRTETKSSEEKGFFFLPDLNMTPIEQDEILYRTSFK